jgi:glyoxylase-like metal-dependent hydrolase (beta-lactamase superfamily II)
MIQRLILGEFQTNTYLLYSQNELAVIDPAGEAVLDEIKIPPKYIINTHGHIDHISANRVVKDKTNARLLIHEDDAPLLIKPHKNLSLFTGSLVKSPPADLLLKEDDTIVIGALELRVIHTPGHTKGGICLLAKEFVFSGDTLFYDSIGRTDLPGGSEKEIFESLKKLLDLLTDDMMVYPGHGDPGWVSEIKKINPFIQELLET